MERLFTIGAYGYDAKGFFNALRKAEVDLFLDIRRRRGIRGPDYTFGNAGRLTKELAARGIAYRHLIELAPEEETRRLQKQADASEHVPTRRRAQLSQAFIADYTHRTLDTFDWQALIEELHDVRRPVLFCVEASPSACHRHLVAEQLAELTTVPVTHLVP
jgi:uncharacterized protein (DUF488 family)